MTDMMMPTWLKCARVGFRYFEQSGMSRPEYGGVVKTGSRGGDRWAASLEFTPAGTSSTTIALERAALIAFLTRLRGRQNRAYLTNPARRLRGSFPVVELLSNNTFENGTTGWTFSSEYTGTAADRRVRCTRSAITTAVVAIRNSTLLTTATANFPHVFRAMLIPGKGTFNGLQIRAGSTNGGNEWGSAAIASTLGLITFTFTPTTTDLSCTIRDTASSAPPNVGDFFTVPYLSAARCGLVAGASQTGSGINTDGWPVSTNGLLLPGDEIELITSYGSELKVMTEALNSDSGGAGYLKFESPLRGTLADNSPVIVHEPMGRFVFTGDLVGWENEPGIITRAAAEFEETA